MRSLKREFIDSANFYDKLYFLCQDHPDNYKEVLMRLTKELEGLVEDHVLNDMLHELEEGDFE